MGMEITKSFVVKAPAAAVWDFLTDPYRVGRCLPGAAITEKVDDQTYAGTITIKVGAGDGELSRQDEVRAPRPGGDGGRHRGLGPGKRKARAAPTCG